MYKDEICVALFAVCSPFIIMGALFASIHLYYNEEITLREYEEIHQQILSEELTQDELKPFMEDDKITTKEIYKLKKIKLDKKKKQLFKRTAD